MGSRQATRDTHFKHRPYICGRRTSRRPNKRANGREGHPHDRCNAQLLDYIQQHDNRRFDPTTPPCTRWLQGRGLLSSEIFSARAVARHVTIGGDTAQMASSANSAAENRRANNPTLTHRGQRSPTHEEVPLLHRPLSRQSFVLHNSVRDCREIGKTGHKPFPQALQGGDAHNACSLGRISIGALAAPPP